MELLEVKHIKKVYNTRLGAKQCVALSDISFEVARGEFVGIMGPSGSGKTTLLNLIASLDKPSGGEILLSGKNFSQIKNRELSKFRRENLGFVFQDFNLLDTFSIKDNILLPLVLADTPVAQMEERISPIVRELGIESLTEKFPYEVSGGEKQRAAIARAIITNPKIILADEPTGALDSKSSANLLKTFETLNKGGQTILMVTHSIDAASYASRVIFIKDGMLYNQIYKGGESRKAFRERIMTNMSLLTEGEGEDE
ncbi:MAG: ABC transporter ATP-binding protein [Eubacteriaceae bacterium]|nr:ABC transporter ATP-binding protein [Eubacteriaceae bacterium]